MTPEHESKIIVSVKVIPNSDRNVVSVMETMEDVKDVVDGMGRKKGNQGNSLSKTRHLLVRVKEKPTKGKANLAVISLLSSYFKVPSSHIRIIRGLKSNKKYVEVIT